MTQGYIAIKTEGHLVNKMARGPAGTCWANFQYCELCGKMQKTEETVEVHTVSISVFQIPIIGQIINSAMANIRPRSSKKMNTKYRSFPLNKYFQSSTYPAYKLLWCYRCSMCCLGLSSWCLAWATHLLKKNKIVSFRIHQFCSRMSCYYIFSVVLDLHKLIQPLNLNINQNLRSWKFYFLCVSFYGLSLSISHQ